MPQMQHLTIGHFRHQDSGPIERHNVHSAHSVHDVRSNGLKLPNTSIERVANTRVVPIAAITSCAYG